MCSGRYIQVSLGHNLIGINYESVGAFNEAEKNYNRALDYARLVNNDTLIGRAYNNLGNIYFVRDRNLEKSNSFYFKSRSVAIRQKDTAEILIPTLNLAWNYLEVNDPDNALNYLKEADTYFTSFNNPASRLFMGLLYGNYHTQQGNYNEAVEEYDKALRQSENSTAFNEIADVYLAKSKALESLGLESEAANARNSYKVYKSKVTPGVSIGTIDDMAGIDTALSQTEALDTISEELASLESIPSGSEEKSFFSRNLHWFLYPFLILIFAGILLFIIYRNRKSEMKLTELLNTRNEHLEAAKEEAEKLSRLKSQFISTVSHELRTPLYGVVGLTSLLLEENNLSAQENQYLKSLKFSGDYLLNLINDILNLSKIESNKVSFEKTPFNIRELVEDVISSFKFQLDQKNNKIHLYIDKKVPSHLKGDGVPLSQVLINLIGNAVKFTSYGNIWVFLKLISLEDDVASINFIVKDDGPGIPKEKHAEIFENFSQLDRENNHYQGTGLGLAIVKKLIDLMEGDIKLTSAEGEGATFSFTLKFDVLKEANGSIEGGKFEKDILGENIFGKGYKVLIVEDNKINQIVTKNILLRENFECEVVDNGLTAIEYAKNEKYDLILMDLNMPLMSGIEASSKIRQFDKTTPIVALTAVEIEDVREDIAKAGINDIINKPFDKSEFYKIILRNISNNKNRETVSK